MASDHQELSEQYYRLMETPADIGEVASLYAPEALVIRFNETSAGIDEISTFLADVATRHQPYKLHSIDQFTQVGDVVMWDAVVDTAKGMLETTEVFVLDEAGKIKRHIPGFRGYWGQ